MSTTSHTLECPCEECVALRATLTPAQRAERMSNSEIAALIASHDALVATLQSVADDAIAMRGFHEQFRAQIRTTLAQASKA